jgi:hypothetical protein
MFPRCAFGIKHQYFVVLCSFPMCITAVISHVFMALHYDLECCNSMIDLAC